MKKVFTVNLPDIGEGVVEGEVIEWLKQVNDAVKQDEPVVVVMTDKATVELPAPYPGKIVKHYFQPGQTAIRDKPLYAIELSEEETLVEPKAAAEEPERVAAPAAPQAVAVATSAQVLATPPVRQLARELGIDIGRVQGTGPEGRVTADDLRNYAAPAEEAALALQPDDEELPLVGVRHLMVKKMQEAHDKIPPFSYFEQVDATRLVQLRQKIKEEAVKEHIRLTYMPFFIRALSLTIAKYPSINSSLDPHGDTLILHKHHNIGIAMAVQQGLVVPVLKGVENLSLEGIIKAYEELKNKAMDNKLTPADMKQGTITISNFGVLGNGGLWATPIINYPEVAIVAVAKIHPEPIVKNNAVGIRDVLHLSWSFDHRVIDGELAAAVSHYFSSLIYNPATLL